MDQQQTQTGVTRRDLLKRGAALGGAIVWMTPVVQTVGMAPAFAQDCSPLCCLEIVSVIATQGSDQHDVTATIVFRNCGCETAQAIAITIERDDGTGFDFQTTDPEGNLDPGEDGMTDLSQTNLGTGTYTYRAKGAFTCGGVRHDPDPPVWVVSNTVTVT